MESTVRGLQFGWNGQRLVFTKHTAKLIGGFVVYHRKPDKWSEGPNVPRFQRPLLLSHCLDGMTAKPFEYSSVQVNSESFSDVADQIRKRFTPQHSDRVELEMIFGPSAMRFSGDAECNVLVGRKLSSIPRALWQQVGLFIQRDDNLTDSKSIADRVIAEVRRGLGIDPREDVRGTVFMQRCAVPSPQSIAG